MIDFKTYTDEMLAYAKLDCYETLEVVESGQDITYKRKLWAEIDAIRDVEMSRRAVKATVGRKINNQLWHTRSNGQPLDTEE